jgi:hypothetical protein
MKTLNAYNAVVYNSMNENFISKGKREKGRLKVENVIKHNLSFVKLHAFLRRLEFHQEVEGVWVCKYIAFQDYNSELKIVKSCFDIF